MEEGFAIKVDQVSKSFKLPHERQSSIKSALINFHKRGYEKQEVLKGIDFEVKKGEFFGIVGRNGSGKSTLLKLLAGIYTPNGGQVHVRGKVTAFIELGVGFNPELTGRENVFLNGALLGFNRKEMTAMYDEIVDFAELERFMDQKLKNYSSGMQVRLAFSVAIRAQSEILILDEVLAVGDAAFQKKCFDYFMKLKKMKRTVVLVTHDMNAVRQYCDRVIMIDKGKIVNEGNPDTIAQAYQRLFIEEQGKIKVSDERWGTGKMLMQKTELDLRDDTLTINCQFKSKQSLDSPVLGFTIYGPSGINILEGNTIRGRQQTDPVVKGDVLEISWSLPDIFSEGEYSVSVACCNPNATEYYDWVNNAATFTINREGNTAGVVDPPLRINKYEKKHAH